MKIKVQSQEANWRLVRLSGRVIQSLEDPSDPLVRALGPDCYRYSVGIGLSEVEAMDSSGIGWLLRCHRHFEELGGRLVLHSLSAEMQRLFSMLKLQRVIKLVGTEEEALSIIAGPGQGEE